MPPRNTVYLKEKPLEFLSRNPPTPHEKDCIYLQFRKLRRGRITPPGRPNDPIRHLYACNHCIIYYVDDVSGEVVIMDIERW